MKKFKVLIFTEEYSVNVLIGARIELKNELRKYTGFSMKSIERDFDGRGITYNCYPEKHPIIAIDGDLIIPVCLATLAHESVHALDYLMAHISINANETEFRAHGVAAIFRVVLENILKKKNPPQ